jgi:uncharacterized protein (TIGR02646 family)
VALFQYPKIKHSRRLTPRQFKRYRSYKRFLQNEFSRVCVYCRQPDSSAPNLNFGVDHYRPKGIARFADLVCSYANLYYCCGDCNSRKNNDWPLDEKAGPYVVNPCDHEMAAHLRFDKTTGRVETRTPDGVHTEELLQLNNEASVKYRLSTVRTVNLYLIEIEKLKSQQKAIARKLRSGEISQQVHDAEVQAISQEIADARDTVQMHTGEVPLPPLRKQRLGVTVLP